VTCGIFHGFHGMALVRVAQLLLYIQTVYDQDNNRIPVLASLEKSTCPGESMRFTINSSSSIIKVIKRPF